MATDSWALAVDEQEAAAESLSNLNLKEEKIKPDANGAVVKTNANAEKTDEEEKVKSFEELRLKPQLLQGVYAMGFNRPSKIQENALPLMLAEPPQNLIAQSQSGTGKTAAFVLAMLSQVEPANRYPQLMQLKELNVERGQKISEHIVIGTPGTVLDWCSKLKFIDPKKIKVFVLDEADVMIATQGHQDQSIRIQRMLPRNCQMLLFSATFEDSVWKFAQKVVPDPNIIKLKREEETLDTIKQYYVLCNNRDEKFQALCNLYGAITIAQAMIFCHTRKTASWLAAELSKEGHQVALLSGEMVVEQRAAVIERFREGKEKVLVTTNVCARGIDVEQVSVVINFDLPVDKDGNPDNETYLHRIGRTGRFGKRGLAVNMVDSKHSMNILNRIQEHFSESPGGSLPRPCLTGAMERGQKISEHIVIGTPGTVLDWCSKLKFIDPKKIKVFVLDEADVMIATQGHQDQSIRIQRMLPRNCQMLLFSATFEDSVWKFAQKVVPDPNIIKLKREEETLDTIKQYYVLCNNRDEKFQALCNLYGAITIAQAMIFCHTRKTASWLAAELSKEGHQVALLSGEMVVEQRAAVIERFREGKEKVLVTTNVCARGIDVEQVSVVINFDLPVDKDGNPDNETYLHRIGRTGRFGKRGLAVNMVDSKHSMNILNRIQEHFNKKIERLDTDDLDEIEKIAN
ncbi:ATP-dependent RNA helicase DDX19B [Camelus dromedarius]|uniref:RNA helicase n=2 Tax=Camelus dromedarius TaxID=9838 RepID=A0A5N4DUH4_CAMDR|nr:ATP-dependent RNA helicase DDX19B [Camelus dromedarius]